MNYQQILERSSKVLKTHDIKNSNLDSELILTKALNKTREQILTNFNNKITQKQIKKFNIYLSRRKKKEPIAYILGFKHFWKYKFLINNSVLIPRPDTEIIIEEALKCIPHKKSKKILDIGTGSGCIVISIINERAKCTATALDICKKAINIAKTNAKLHHLGNKIKFINIDIDKYKSNNYDLIISNPPYINSISLNRLDDDVKLHEPKLALSGGLDGYKEIKRIIKRSKYLLKLNGKLIIEIGDKQRNQAVILLRKNGFYVNKVSKDLSGKDRCIISTRIYNEQF